MLVVALPHVSFIDGPHVHEHVEVGTFKLPLPSTASLAYAPAQPGTLPVVTSANATGPDQPAGGDAVHWYPAFRHTGSAQSMSPLQLSSMPFVQSSAPPLQSPSG